MSTIKSLLIGLFIGAILIILSKKNEMFTNSKYFREYTGSDIIIPPEPSIYPTKQNELIIPSNDEYNSFPLKEFDPKIIPPVPIIYDAKPNEAYKDTDFRRDVGVDKAMDTINNRIVKSYSGVENAYNVYNIPIDSSSELKYKKYDEITNKDNMYLADIHDLMTAKVAKQLTKEEFNNIGGIPVPVSEINIPNKSVYMSIDDDDTRELFKVDYKYQPFETLPIGSLIN